MAEDTSNGAGESAEERAEPASPETTEAAAAAPAPETDPLELAKQEAARFKEQLLRTAADFDNFRKRSRRENTEAERKGREDLLRDLLPVFDDIERAASHAEAATDAVAEGIRMVIKRFGETLTKLGIQRIQAMGEPFDPAVHEAIQQVETSDHPPGTVVHEIQAGYRTSERLIRPASVVVAKAKAG